MNHYTMDRNRQRGFTLIELMVVVAIAALLAMVAIPSYDSFVTRTRRSEAREALSDFAARQEQFFLNNKSYSNSVAALGRGTATSGGYYNISIPLATTTAYTLRADAQSPQDRDTDCAVMTLTSTGSRAPADCW